MALLRISDERPDAEIGAALDATIISAESEFAPLRFEGEYPETGIGIAEIRPRHVGIANDFWQMSVTTSFANWINVTLNRDAFVLVTGIFNNTIDPSTTELFPSANGKDLPIVNIEQMYGLDEQRVWFSKPFAVRPANVLKIQTVGRVAQTERLGLEGFTVAKRSFLINTAP